MCGVSGLLPAWKESGEALRFQKPSMISESILSSPSCRKRDVLVKVWKKLGVGGGGWNPVKRGSRL